MRRKDKEITSKGDLAEIMRQGEVCYLAMIDGEVDDREPYVVPLNYGYRDNALYFHTAPEGRKIDILKRNPKVAFTVVPEHEITEGGKGCSWSARYTSVMGTGTATILTDQAEKNEGLKILMAQYSDDPFNFSDKELEGVAVVKINIEKLTGKGNF